MRAFIIIALLAFSAPAFAMDPYQHQLELARIQANGMAMMGAGAAFANGMQQGFKPLPMPVMPTVQPYSVPVPRSPIRCITSNPGAMQSTFCY